MELLQIEWKIAFKKTMADTILILIANNHYTLKKQYYLANVLEDNKIKMGFMSILILVAKDLSSLSTLPTVSHKR